MRKIFLLLSVLVVGMIVNAQILKKLGDKVKQKMEEKNDKGTTDTTKKENPPKEESKNEENTSNNTITTAAPSLKVYANYDFVPGDKILFEDNFADDQDGEFATHWELKAGQAVLNKINGELTMNLTDGNYARVLPRIKTEKYLSDPYTIEFDWYHRPGAYGLNLLMGLTRDGDHQESDISIQPAEMSFNGNVGGISLSKNYPEEIRDNFDNKWHHVALAFKNHQLKIYLDQTRMLVVPDTKEDFESITFAGIGSEESPVTFKNIRIATGGNQNMIGKKFTETKIVTHGINFDIDKATIKPESMGTLNMIVQVLKDNPDLKFEIDGHTDNTGSASHNLTLSQQRADAVKDQLIKMGVEASRLTSKGFGDTKPVSDNTSLDGRANNRRVEFIKM